MRPLITGALLGAVLGAAALAGCETKVKAPFDAGVCYYVVMPGQAEATDKGAGEKAQTEPRFNVVARDQPQIESCAARLEEMRLRFLRLGGSNREVVGSYQGQFIFIDRGGVSFGRTLDGNRFFALARSGDGRLVVPGAIERPPAGADPAAPTSAAPAQ